MSQSTSFDYIVVGQGLAGSAVAAQLLLRKKKILVIDQYTESTASRIAAGIFNPIAGKKMTRTWMAEKLFPYLYSFYQQVEEITGVKFFHPVPIYRPFNSPAEQNEWMAVNSDTENSKFIKQVYTSAQYPELLNDQLGGLLLNYSGYLDTHEYLKAVRKMIEREGICLNEAFYEEELTWGDEIIAYRNYRARKIIFCLGAQSLMSKLWEWAPIRPLKGEMLGIRGNFLADALVNRGVYLVPDRNGIWKVGSTYQHHFSDSKPSEAGKAELQEKLGDLVKTQFEIVYQYAAVRPTTPDRKPILGEHPEFKNVLIFNGLGTKGVSLSPYFSDHLISSLENQSAINKEVDISRYKSLYWNSH